MNWGAFHPLHNCGWMPKSASRRTATAATLACKLELDLQLLALNRPSRCKPTGLRQLGARCSHPSCRIGSNKAALRGGDHWVAALDGALDTMKSQRPTLTTRPWLNDLSNAEISSGIGNLVKAASVTLLMSAFDQFGHPKRRGPRANPLATALPRRLQRVIRENPHADQGI